MLKDGIGCDCCAVTNFLYRTAVKATLLKNLGEAFDNCLCVVTDAGRDLFGVDSAVRTEQNNVCESAANIYAYTVCDHRATTLAC